MNNKMLPAQAQRRRNVQEYFDSVRRLKQQSIDEGMPDKEFKKLYHNTLDSLSGATMNRQQQENSKAKRKKYAALIVMGLTLIIASAYYQVIYSCIASNLQDFIYPGLRLLRSIFIPIIEFFSSITGKNLYITIKYCYYYYWTYSKIIWNENYLHNIIISELYQELCLFENPFFTVPDMDCWPCSTLDSVIEVHNPRPVYELFLPPYIYKVHKINQSSHHILTNFA